MNWKEIAWLWLTAIVCGAVGYIIGFSKGEKACRHDWMPEGFADWKCSKCGRDR